LVQFLFPIADPARTKICGRRFGFDPAGLAKSFLLCSSRFNLGGRLMDIEKMDIEKQREIIKLWNRMRRVEGPIAEEIRIQILEYFAQQERTKRAA